VLNRVGLLVKSFFDEVREMEVGRLVVGVVVVFELALK
jgi:hypothetical protein